jgi:uncharacterized protein YuzE
MIFKRATFDPDTETAYVNGKAYPQAKYWKTQEGVSDTDGVWDEILGDFIPDGFYDNLTGYIKLI